MIYSLFRAVVDSISRYFQASLPLRPLWLALPPPKSTTECINSVR